MDELPPCTVCGKPSVTRDGRHLCKKCLMRWVCRETPIGYGRPRSADARQDESREPSPWGELNVRRMEDAGND